MLFECLFNQSFDQTIQILKPQCFSCKKVYIESFRINYIQNVHKLHFNLYF